MAKTENQDFYVGLKDPVTVRKTMLETVKGMVTVLQRLELIKEIRKDKVDAVGRLKVLTHEITTETNQLRSKLPKPSKAMTDELKAFMGAEKADKVEEAIEEVAKAPEKIEAPVKQVQVNKLESELKEIEKELEKLS